MALAVCLDGDCLDSESLVLVQLRIYRQMSRPFAMAGQAADTSPGDARTVELNVLGSAE